MSENTENVKKIRELEDFDASVQLSEKDYLIVATNEDADGDGTNERVPLTKKATIAQAVEAYNNSIAQPPAVDPNTGQPAEPDPEEQPGYEETDPVTGQPVKRITTPVNGGNLDNFLDPDSGLTTVDFCQGADKEEVACDGSEGEVKYKTKKLALDGFTGPEATYQYAFPSTLRNYNGGILTSITYGFGKFLEQFGPLLENSGTDTNIMRRWFKGMDSPMTPGFGMIILANDSADQNFDNSKGGAWFFHMSTGNWYFLSLGNPSRLNTNYVENYWLWNERLGWFWLSLDLWPAIYLDSDRTSGGNTVSKGWVWASEETGNELKDFSLTMYFYSQSAWIDITNFTAASSPPAGAPPASPTTTITSSVPTEAPPNRIE